MGGKSATKAAYFDKLKGLLDEYKTIFIVSVDNVSSQQMHEIRLSLRGEGVVLMGKNTMVSRQRTVIFSRALLPIGFLSFLGSPCSQGIHLREPRIRTSPASLQGLVDSNADCYFILKPNLSPNY